MAKVFASDHSALVLRVEVPGEEVESLRTASLLATDKLQDSEDHLVDDSTSVCL